MRMKDSRGNWINPWKVCPDARQSKVHKGRYWSNTACKNDFTRNKGGGRGGGYQKRSAGVSMMDKLGELLK